MSTARICLQGLRTRNPDTRFWRNLQSPRFIHPAPYLAEAHQPAEQDFKETSQTTDDQTFDELQFVLPERQTSRSLLHHGPRTTPSGQAYDISGFDQDLSRIEPDHEAKRIRTSLGRAIESSNLTEVDRLFIRFGRLVTSTDRQLSDAVMRGTCEHFMFGYFRLRWEKMALQAWQLMVNNGCEPTVQTWSILIKGCHWDKDHRRMESVWARMRASGVQPDVHAWTTRLFGLFRHGRPREGIMALEEMSQEWMRVSRYATAECTHIDGVPKPNTAVLNCAVSGLSSRAESWIPRVLAWAQKFDIEPDVSTYNTLLQVSLAASDSGKVSRILQTMHERHVKPNAATSTIMLNDLFRQRTFTTLSQDAQTTTVMDLIHSLARDEIPIDERGYALIIDRLLKGFSNAPAVHAVLEHMRAHDQMLTPHIYTILMTYYFQLDPPDLSAAEALWRQIKAGEHYAQKVDVIFYDRMIEGYARHGDRGRMMAFLTRMGAEGKRPGWLAITAVVECLAQYGEWNRIRELVRDAEFGGGMLRAGMRGIKGQTDFWALIRRLDLDKKP